MNLLIFSSASFWSFLTLRCPHFHTFQTIRFRSSKIGEQRSDENDVSMCIDSAGFMACSAGKAMAFKAHQLLFGDGLEGS